MDTIEDFVKQIIDDAKEADAEYNRIKIEIAEHKEAMKRRKGRFCVSKECEENLIELSKAMKEHS